MQFAVQLRPPGSIGEAQPTNETFGLSARFWSQCGRFETLDAERQREVRRLADKELGKNAAEVLTGVARVHFEILGVSEIDRAHR